ncbi:MAG: UPF0182 family protein [archaeon]
MKKSFKFILFTVFIVLITFLILIFTGSKIYTDVLWFQNLGFLQSYLVRLLSNYGLRLIIGIIFTVIIYINLHFTKKPFLNFAAINNNQEDNVESLFSTNNNKFFKWINKKRINYIYFFASIVLGFLFSSISQDLWKIVLKYFNQTSFNISDPIFTKDLSFYVFSLPFLSFIKEMGMVLVILNIIVVGIIYILASGINGIKELGVKLSSRAKTHITILIAAFLFLKAWDYRLGMYDLLYSKRGLVFGAGYTDINANLVGLRILFFIALAIGILVLFSLFRKNYKSIIYGVGLWLIASLIFGLLYPAFIQQFRVEPNEIQLESKYISNNIDMTLKAYNLDKVDKRDFTLKNDLNEDNFYDNEKVISNIRLWDSRPLKFTYSQLQELRQYYEFANIDTDRYKINGDYKQVMLSVRELNQNNLSSEAQTWINQTLKYTHGYGLAMSPVNKVNKQGLPNFYINDIPPKNNTDIELNNSSIYYGERTDNNVIVNTDSSEFHYPQGDKNVETSYEGNGGVKLNNILRKLVFTVKNSNSKFLLNTDINNESRIMYYRNIDERVRKIAPFLEYDGDPYPVIHNEQIFWIQDAYTTSNKFPYSTPINDNTSTNYVRNSIKVVIDAYNGDVKFYVVDENDPIAMTYKNIFPDLFVSGDKMPENLRNHLRYPKDLFNIQSELYKRYHMKDPVVFYNKEDLWEIPKENYSGNTVDVEPYYIMSKFPENDQEEFILMRPFTPSNKNNMVSWMAARMDGENYGDLVVYKFPKDKLTYGPTQIESRIDQDSDISQLFSLWSQRGSKVIRGNLLVIPVKNSILYVEPIYLQAESSELPELKRVVVAYGDEIIMRNNLELALAELFGVKKLEEEVEESIQESTMSTTDINSLIKDAMNNYDDAIEAQKSGKWSEYGNKIDELKDILNQLEENSQVESDINSKENNN